MQAENITQAQFADTLSVARGSVSHILAGRNKPGYDFLESLLLHYPSLNLDWLVTGKGKMYREDASAAPEASEFPQDSLFSSIQIPQTPLPSRQIDRITVFWSDNTYQEFFTKE